MHLSFASSLTSRLARLGRVFAVTFAVSSPSVICAAACGSSSSPSPFVLREGGAADGGEPDGGDVPPLPTAEPDSGSPDVPGEWGGPCIDDGNCNDSLDCTADACDSDRKRCHFAPLAERCDDHVFCNGAEVCVPGVGCRAGEAEACSDGTTCTIDACDEETRTCSHALRDADGDGDADGNCPGGHDCNDQDDTISSARPELCGNGVDDDCDGQRDEPECESPKYDTCADPFAVTAAGTYALSVAAAKSDYSATCVSGQAALPDVVLKIRVPGGDPVDLDVGVTSDAGDVALAAFTKCGDASAEAACGPGIPAARGTRGARLVLHGERAGFVYVTLFGNAAQALGVSVDFPPATDPPTNETCSTALPLAPDTHVTVPLASASRDLENGCIETHSDLVYSFTLSEPKDVRVTAAALDVYGTPVLSLRRSPCDAKNAELVCASSDGAQLFRRALAAGTYFVVAASTGQSALDLVLEESAPTAPSADESCATAPPLTPGVGQVVDLDEHEDDIAVKCALFGVDAAYALTLTEPSDVLLALAIPNGDVGGVSLTTPACSVVEKPVACRTRNQSPIRASARAVPAGEYRVVAEAQSAGSVALAAFVRPATPPVLVAFSDGCADAVEIPETGGAYTGNTQNATDDFSASCDVGQSAGAPDQFLAFHLSRRSRVILDARGSAYSVILDVRRGASCPGDEVPSGCSAGYVDDRSFIDLALDPGDYKVQIDGYLEQSGAWTVDAFISPAG